MGRKSKKEYMQDKTFSELMEAAEQALAYERGALDGYRVMRVESAKSPLKVSADEVVFAEEESKLPTEAKKCG